MNLVKTNRAAYAVIAVVVIFRLILLAQDPSYLVQKVSDDSFYYFKVAQNIASGNGSSFDSINRTNGFHPLWMAILVVIYKILPSDTDFMFRVILLFQVGMLAAAMVLIYRMISSLVSRGAGLLCAVLFVWPGFLKQMIEGMEAGILIILLLATVLFMKKHNVFNLNVKSIRDLYFGVLLGLIFLARLDTVFLIITVALMMVYTFIKQKMFVSYKVRISIGDLIVKLILVIGPVALISFPYFYWNYVNFGSLMPISGALKNSFPVPAFHYGYILRFKGVSLLIMLLSGMMLLYLLRNKIRKSRLLEYFYTKSDCLFLLHIFGIACILHWANTLVFMKWAVFPWHFAMYIPFGLLGLGLLFDWFFWLLQERFEGSPQLTRAMYTGALVCLAALMLMGQYVSFKRRVLGFHRPAYQAAMWARENTGHDAVLAMKDCGTFGYFSKRSVINLDGIINNLEYQEYLKEGRFGEYLKDKNVTYFVSHAAWGYANVNSGDYLENRFDFYSHLYNTNGGVVTVRKKDEVYRSPRYYDGPYETVFIIWKL